MTEQEVARMAWSHRLQLLKDETAVPPGYCLQALTGTALALVFGHDQDKGIPIAVLKQIVEHLRSEQAGDFRAILKDRVRDSEGGPDNNLVMVDPLSS